MSNPIKFCVISPSAFGTIKCDHFPLLHVLSKVKWDAFGNISTIDAEDLPEVTAYDPNRRYLAELLSTARRIPKNLRAVVEGSEWVTMITRPFFVQYTHENILYIATPANLMAYQAVVTTHGRTRQQRILCYVYDYATGSYVDPNGETEYSLHSGLPMLLAFESIYNRLHAVRLVFATSIPAHGRVPKLEPFDGAHTRDPWLMSPYTGSPDTDLGKFWTAIHAARLVMHRFNRLRTANTMQAAEIAMTELNPSIREAISAYVAVKGRLPLVIDADDGKEYGTERTARYLEDKYGLVF